jgi:hypothetical protein
LKNFGKFTVAKVSETEVSPDKMILQMFSDLQSEIAGIRRRLDTKNSEPSRAKIPTAVGVLRKGFRESLLRDAIGSYCTKHGVTDYNALIDDIQFIKSIEKMIDASKHFESFDEFKHELSTILKIMYPSFIYS